MIKKITISMIAILIAVLISSVIFKESAHSYPTGAPSGTTGYTGSPIDGGQNCTSCHSGTAVSATGIITSTVPLTGYVPGTTYTITATVKGVGNKGFEMFAQNSTAAAGSFISGNGTKTVNGGSSYITHSTDPSSNPQVWTFSWTAPATGMGDITFYGAFAITEDTTKLSTMLVHQYGTGIEENSENRFTLYPNPAKDNMFISYSLFCNSKVEISVYSIDGKKIATTLSQEQSTGNHKEQININALNPQGVYFVELKIAGESSLQKIVIE